MSDHRLLLWLLRFDALVLTLAFVAIFLSDSFMATTHERLGLGVFPESPLVAYLTRSAAVLYGTRGLFVWLASTDLDRYRDLIVLIGVSNILIGALLVGIDLYAGMPGYWTWLEGPPIAAVGALVLFLVPGRQVAGESLR